MTLSLNETFRKLMTFGSVGVIGTAAHYVTLIALVESLGINPVVATTLGFLVGAVVNYLLNHRYTFRSKKAHLDAGSKFLLIAIATGLLNALLVHVGVNLAGLNYLLVQVVATLAVFLANFALNSLWTFREPDSGTAPN